MNFLELGLSPKTVQAIDEFGITEPTTVQADVIPSILQGKDVFTIAPAGCGKTTSYVFPLIDLRNVLGDDGAYFEKDTLSCYKNDNIRRAIEKSGKKQLIIAGLETHLCVLQTAIDFAEAGYNVFVVADSSSSRNGMQSVMGVQRLLRNGVDVVTREMVMFEWMDQSGSPLFNELWERRP
jgi:superfamily II DNA/RNA helicase